MDVIIGSNIGFRYGNDAPVLEHADFVFKSGKTTAILGKNGCGKSTLAKLILALLPHHEGKLTVRDLDVNTQKGLAEVRKHCGIVFQNPDNQFVSPIIEDDIRFGLENHGVPEKDQPELIRKALAEAGLSGFEKRNISTLSGGQKQRAAFAGILAIGNDILIFDEATAMLDPEGKAELLSCLEDQKSSGKTVIIITQDPDDVLCADTILLMNGGMIKASGAPRDVLTDASLLSECGVRVPFPVRVYHDLLENGIRLPHCPLTRKELSEEICSLR